MEEFAWGPIFFVAPLTPIAVLVAAAIVYFKFRVTVGGTRRSAWLFALGAFAAGIVVGWLGTGLGVLVYCSSFHTNLCGLGGFFVVGPLSFSLAVSAYLFFWAKKGKAP